jgi:alanyl-tRNA synthetase
VGRAAPSAPDRWFGNAFMTKRLYYDDSYLTEFRARVIETSDDGRRVYLDQTAFYPTSGGQPFDTGTLGGARVLDVVDEDDRVAHIVDAPVGLGEVEAHVDAARRFDHMQQHTGQHLLSAVLEELFQAPTLSFHMGADSSTIEIGAASLDARQMERAEERCAEMVREARPISISFEDATSDLGLRKESQRTGTLRIISIGDFDRSACGGTHVRTSAEIGPVFIRKTEKLRGNLRLEFVCGLRALRHARADFRMLQDISRHLSAPAERAPDLVAAQIERIKTLEKTAMRLAIELAQREGRELWAATKPDADGIRRFRHTGAMDGAVRTRAQAFVAQGKAVFVAVCEDPPSLLLAASPDSGIHAGERVKAAVTSLGGRGGGNAALAQGSLPKGADVQSVGLCLME